MLDPRSLPNVPTLTAERIYQHDSILGECPLWEEREQVLYWIDIDRGEIHRFSPLTKKNQTFSLPTKVTSIARRSNGGLIASLRKNIAFFDPTQGHVEILDEIEADLPENRFNDGKVDRQGRLWVGSMNEVHVGQPTAALYCYKGPKQYRKVIPNVTISNGTGWSPDSKTMYYTDTLRYTVYAYDFDPQTGELANRRIFYQVNPEANGLPDGLTVDAEGFIWSALVNYGRILRLDPSGQLERTIIFPPTRGTSCTFGGPNYTDLYITTARECLTPEEIANQPLAGSLFHCQPGVKGLPEPGWSSEFGVRKTG